MPNGKGPLAELRVRKGYSRKQLIERIKRVSGMDLHPNWLGQLESGRAGTRTDTLEVLALALGEPVEVVLRALLKCRAQFARRGGQAA